MSPNQIRSSILVHIPLTPLAIGALALTAGLWSFTTPAEAKRKLSCTQIAKQCNRYCVREAPPAFCSGYCSDQRRQCLQTGEWLGMTRTFRNVRRR